MLVGLSGTHGTGKSTILQAAENTGFIVDRTQISRSVQARLGWDRLSCAEDSIENMIALQEEIANVMYDRDIEYARTPQLTLVERTPADVWAYTKVWCSRHGLNAETYPWAQDYKCRLRRMSAAYHYHVFVPQVKEIPFVEDPNRADFASRLSVEIIIESYIFGGGLRAYVIKGITREERSAEIAALYTMLRAML